MPQFCLRKRNAQCFWSLWAFFECPCRWKAFNTLRDILMFNLCLEVLQKIVITKAARHCLLCFLSFHATQNPPDVINAKLHRRVTISRSNRKKCTIFSCKRPEVTGLIVDCFVSWTDEENLPQRVCVSDTVNGYIVKILSHPSFEATKYSGDEKSSECQEKVATILWLLIINGNWQTTRQIQR